MIDERMKLVEKGGGGEGMVVQHDIREQHVVMGRVKSEGDL